MIFFKLLNGFKFSLECLTNHTLETCNCVSFSMPRDDKTKICENYSEMECLIDAKSYWINHKTSSSTSIKPCDCLDHCNNVEYFVKFTKNSDLDPLLQNLHKKLEK